MRTLGKGMAEFRRMSTDVKSTLDAEVDRADREQRQAEAKKQLYPETAQETVAAAQATAATGTPADKPAGTQAAPSGKEAPSA
jgi:sec-independent protein translocase protein TatB